MFIDEARIYVRSGRGGAGVVHFHREKYVPRGGPDGGDGGKGGDVIFRVVPTLNTLQSFRFKHKFVAPDGENGGGSNMTGKSAKDLVIPVPPGTLIYDAETNELLGDMVDPGQELVVCKGGRGGRGNQHFATSRNQAPRTAEKGEPPEEKVLRLELKLLADVGIVGVPNAGKSSFLAAVTNAKPKIADYPFTTIEPNLGVAHLDEEIDLILADIPGLIEGAHEGVGLGDAFLKHIQRTRVLIHVIDGMAADPVADFTQINSELALFDPELGHKPQIVVVNKIDLPDVQARWDQLKTALKKLGYEAHAISAITRENLTPILWKAHEILMKTPKPEITPALPIYKPEEDPRDFHITREENGWRVTGAAIERAAEMTYWEHDGSVRRFQRLMVTLGVDEALRERGIKEGDTVFINDYELEWQE
ncbi:MAG: GTPase ObgE [Anaerolineaceae bacterium]|nr:GTPase ObgE [Anaerolineaceae bacterium]